MAAYDFEDSESVVELDAEPDVPAGLQVNYFLLCLGPVIFLLIKLFSRLSVWISQWFFLPSEQERQKILESAQLKGQLNSMSMQNDFAAYSKIQRKLNLITLNLEADALSRKSLRSDMARMIKFGLHFIVGAVYLFTLFWHGTKNPVLVLPSDWFFPLSYILSFPTGVPGGVSLPVWTLLTRTLISYLP